MLSALSLLAYFICIIASIEGVFEILVYGNSKDKDLNIRLLIIPAAIAIVSILMLTFLPNKETMIEMAVAKYATRDNVAWSVDQIKSIVDYIVQAMQSIK